MQTAIFTVEGHADLHACLKPAASIIQRGGIVAFPTETVYGLGANAFDERAVKKIFDAKQRPPDDPLIVHVSSIEMASTLVDGPLPDIARRLAQRFWPGPLTMVFKKHASVPGIVTSGLPTVAIRVPVHPVARALIELSGVPVAAPSANLFERPSPTRAAHVLADLDGRIDGLVDGGEVDVGVESTIIDVTRDPPVLLRPGGVTLEALEALVGRVALHGSVTSKRVDGPVISPGMKSRHYSPKTKLVLVDIDDVHVASIKIAAVARDAIKDGKKVGLILFGHDVDVEPVVLVQLGTDAVKGARALFDSIRSLDSKSLDLIVCGATVEQGLGLAIMNRLKKAATEIIT